jgi:hypothetical protein
VGQAGALFCGGANELGADQILSPSNQSKVTIALRVNPVQLASDVFLVGRTLGSSATPVR